jgi:4-amino-4-deoxy-L-arabinose transferase-like glycosyltransferase
VRPAFAILLLIVLALAVGSVRNDSATSDEPAHIAAGLVKLQYGRFDFFRETPPLMNELSALPLLAAGYRIAEPARGANHWATGKQFLYRSGHDPHRILLLARLPAIALLLALALAVYRFVRRETRSEWLAFAGGVLTAFCPNLLAHGRLATVDVAVTFFCFAATMAFLRLLEEPSPAHGALLGVLTAAAILSKTSGMILLPFFALLFLLFRKRPRSEHLIAIVTAVVVVRLFTPFSDFVANLGVIGRWYGGPYDKPQFLLGRFSFDSWPHYYLVALALKLTLPSLALLAIAIAVVRRRWSRAAAACAVFTVMFLGVAAMGHLALGVRYVLPVLPFVYAFAAMALEGVDRRAVALLLAWHAAECVAAYPSYISYFNELAGGRRNADRLLIDSNLDWGQDLRRLDLWCAENHVEAIAVHYFGGGDPESELHGRVVTGIRPGAIPLPRGWFALSRHYYRLSFFPPVSPVNYDDYLRAARAEYVTTVGGSINVYRVP